MQIVLYVLYGGTRTVHTVQYSMGQCTMILQSGPVGALGAIALACWWLLTGIGNQGLTGRGSRIADLPFDDPWLAVSGSDLFGWRWLTGFWARLVSPGRLSGGAAGRPAACVQRFVQDVSDCGHDIGS